MEMNPLVHVRSAGPEEAAAVLDLMCRAFAEYRGVLKPESSVFVETVEEVAAKLGAGGGFVAMRGLEMVGCVIAEAKGERGYLGRLAVDPALRRQGIAEALIGAAEEHLRLHRLPVVELNVRIALRSNIALFQSLGYRETARAAHPGCPEPTYLVMEKALE